jgi:hypothetical protein
VISRNLARRIPLAAADSVQRGRLNFGCCLNRVVVYLPRTPSPRSKPQKGEEPVAKGRNGRERHFFDVPLVTSRFGRELGHPVNSQDFPTVQTGAFRCEFRPFP